MQHSFISLLCRCLVAMTMLSVLPGLARGDMKPTKFAREVVCEGCHAVIAEANKILGKGRRTDRTVDNAMRAICNVQRLNQYEFSPPTMNKVCDYWAQSYASEIKAALMNGLPEDEQEIDLCFTTTDICRDVDRSRFRINKYEGPSKRKVLAAVKAARGEPTEEEIVEPAEEEEDELAEEEQQDEEPSAEVEDEPDDEEVQEEEEEEEDEAVAVAESEDEPVETEEEGVGTAAEEEVKEGRKKKKEEHSKDKKKFSKKDQKQGKPKGEKKQDKSPKKDKKQEGEGSKKEKRKEEGKSKSKKDSKREKESTKHSKSKKNKRDEL